MQSKEIRQKYLEFFASKGHTIIPSSSLVPENDPTVLFTTAGMHPLVPYLLGAEHPGGKRLADVQKCIRTGDIDEVGDNSHVTFLEMLGNWSLGDYFKKEAIEWSFEFLTSPQWLGLDKNKLSVTVFGGDKRVPQVPKDDEAAAIWRSIGIPEDRIAYMPGGVFEREDNWWGPAGQTGPCGPSTEMFYWVGASELPPPGSNQGTDKNNWLEIWNDVFMQFNRKNETEFEPLKQKNVDTGMGLERITAMLQGKKSVYETELFQPILEKIATLAKIPYSENPSSYRIIADHLRAATFIAADGVTPKNVDQGYILRRIVRRAIREGKRLGIENNFLNEIIATNIDLYKGIYPELEKNKQKILEELNREEEKFRKTLEKGIKEAEKLSEKENITGNDIFYIFETYGFPPELSMEELRKNNKNVPPSVKAEFDAAFKAHQDKSRVGAEQKFAGGLADHSEECTRLHTATHLVHQALRDVLGTHVFQKGSNITRERLRFDFNHPTKMTPEQIKEVEEIVNREIQNDLPIHYELMETEEAKKRGVIGLFDDKYAQLGNKVKVYLMGDYSKEICGGPHVEHTGVLKSFKITKEEACSAGIRRIKAIVNANT